MEPSPRDAIRRVLTTAGVTGAALTLATAAALPALACHGRDDGGRSQKASSQPATADRSAARHSDKDADGGTAGDRAHGASTTSAHRHAGRDGAEQHGDAGSRRTDAKPAAHRDGHNPPGNNGTVFIHQTAGDAHPHNQPHVTCDFYVALFGFDQGQPLSVSFAGQAPTGKGQALPVTDGTATSTTSPDAAGGAGHDYDGDLGPFTVSNLDVANVLGAPAKQGWHIRLTVDTGQGGGHKYKVFWLAPCAGSSTAVAGSGTGAAGQVGGGRTGDTDTAPGNDTGSTVAGSGLSGGTGGAQSPGAAALGLAAGSTTGGAQVLGERMTRATSTGTRVLGEKMTRTSSGASLPFTGTEIGLMSAAGAAAVGGGVLLTVAGRRRRRATAAR